MGSEESGLHVASLSGHLSIMLSVVATASTWDGKTGYVCKSQLFLRRQDFEPNVYDGLIHVQQVHCCEQQCCQQTCCIPIATSPGIH